MNFCTFSKQHFDKILSHILSILINTKKAKICSNNLSKHNLPRKRIRCHEVHRTKKSSSLPPSYSCLLEFFVFVKPLDLLLIPKTLNGYYENIDHNRKEIPNKSFPCFRYFVFEILLVNRRIKFFCGEQSRLETRELVFRPFLYLLADLKR